MAIKPYAGRWVTKWFPLSSAYYLAKGTFMMGSSGEAVQASTSAGQNANPILGLYMGPAIATSALTAGTTRIPLLTPVGTVYIEDTATSGSFTSGTVGLSYGLSSGSATGNFSSTGFTQHLGAGNTTVTPFVHTKFGASSGANVFGWTASLQAGAVT